ncbi:hypothetical protein HPB47_003865, partial [Ixodes persulcatus]
FKQQEKYKVLEADHDEQERWIRKHPRKATTATNPLTPTKTACGNGTSASGPCSRCSCSCSSPCTCTAFSSTASPPGRSGTR